MAKIISVELLSVPETIQVNDDESDITVVTKVKFHDLDILSNMEYCLHLFVYDIRGEVDPLVVIPNWDESSVVSITMDRQDNFLGRKTILMTASEEEISLETPMALKLGVFGKLGPNYARKIEVFATIAPVVGRASKWSKPYSTHILG